MVSEVIRVESVAKSRFVLNSMGPGPRAGDLSNSQKMLIYIINLVNAEI